MFVAGIVPRSVERLPGSITAMNVESRWLKIPLKLSTKFVKDPMVALLGKLRQDGQEAAARRRDFHRTCFRLG